MNRLNNPVTRLRLSNYMDKDPTICYLQETDFILFFQNFLNYIMLVTIQETHFKDNGRLRVKG